MPEKRTEEEIQKIITEIVEETRKVLQGDIYKIVLYGSYARGDFDNQSDLDVMILLNCEKEKVCDYRKKISRVASRIGLENDIEVSLLLRDRNTFERGGEVHPFYRNVRREGVALYG